MVARRKTDRGTQGKLLTWAHGHANKLSAEDQTREERAVTAFEVEKDVTAGNGARTMERLRRARR